MMIVVFSHLLPFGVVCYVAVGNWQEFVSLCLGPFFSYWFNFLYVKRFQGSAVGQIDTQSLSSLSHSHHAHV